MLSGVLIRLRDVNLPEAAVEYACTYARAWRLKNCADPRR